MGVLVLFALVLLAQALPDLAPRLLGLAEHPPDLWLATTAYLASRARGYAAVGWGIGLGLARDVASLDPLGTHAFVLGTVAFLFAEGSRSRGRTPGAVRLAWTGLAAVVAGVLYRVRLLPLGEGLVSAASFLDVLPVALWTVVFAAFLFPLLDRTGALDDLCGRTHGLPA